MFFPPDILANRVDTWKRQQAGITEPAPAACPANMLEAWVWWDRLCGRERFAFHVHSAQTLPPASSPLRVNAYPVRNGAGLQIHPKKSGHLESRFQALPSLATLEQATQALCPQNNSFPKGIPTLKSIQTFALVTCRLQTHFARGNRATLVRLPLLWPPYGSGEATERGGLVTPKSACRMD